MCPQRSQGNDVENRVASQLLTLIDEITAQPNLVLVAATNRPNALDSAVRRAGRFDKEVFMCMLHDSYCRIPIGVNLAMDLLRTQTFTYILPLFEWQLNDYNYCQQLEGI